MQNKPAFSKKLDKIRHLFHDWFYNMVQRTLKIQDLLENLLLQWGPLFCTIFSFWNYSFWNFSFFMNNVVTLPVGLFIFFHFDQIIIKSPPCWFYVSDEQLYFSDFFWIFFVLKFRKHVVENKKPLTKRGNMFEKFLYFFWKFVIRIFVKIIFLSWS